MVLRDLENELLLARARGARDDTPIEWDNTSSYDLSEEGAQHAFYSDYPFPRVVVVAELGPGVGR